MVDPPGAVTCFSQPRHFVGSLYLGSGRSRASPCVTGGGIRERLVGEIETGKARQRNSRRIEEPSKKRDDEPSAL
ncbi:hypothetical protein chiPu_0022957 [Chiloscyllium punctatum]|uniref:Uncharacterized protein n=1 Tax=Chiloscyllium punctatum TaxID=137246 RepID=A0A401T9W3_CHIPU|nr:hypothetical protein [Chiloscyllium punctatum]